VSYCATCDGAFFRNVPVAVIGGGDTAAEEALFLSRFASRVYLIHRRDALRATRILQERIFANDKIEVVWDSLPVQVLSNDRGVSGLEIRNKNSGETRTLDLEGVFFAIGVIPKAHFLADVLELNKDGYIMTDANCGTSMPGVFAAGDVRNKMLKQIATAVGDGAVAAIAAEKFLDEQKK
jgi:thioredoxin reductase (NADPH)